jgi:hypothetical protein
MRPSRRPLRLLVALAVLATVLLAAAPASAASWPTASPTPAPGTNEGGTSALLAYRTASFQDPAAWRQDPAGCAGNSPTVHLGIVLVGGIACRPSGDDGGVRAFDGAVYFSMYANAAYGAPVVSGGRLYVSATTLVDGQPVALHDQFALGAAAPGVIR